MNKILLAVVAAVGLILISTAVIAEDLGAWSEHDRRQPLVQKLARQYAPSADLVRHEDIFTDWAYCSKVSPSHRRSAHWMSSTGEEPVMPVAPDEWDAILVSSLSVEHPQHTRHASNGKLARRLHKAMKRNERKEQRIQRSDRRDRNEQEIASQPVRSGFALAREWFDREACAGRTHQDPGTAEWKRLIRMDRVQCTGPK